VAEEHLKEEVLKEEGGLLVGVELQGEVAGHQVEEGELQAEEEGVELMSVGEGEKGLLSWG
jgi:hypothetical protein